MTAETHSIRTLYLAPTLLNGQFINEWYYKHFVQLVQLLTLCLEFESTQDQISDLERGFQEWVEEYEWYELLSLPYAIWQVSRIFYQHMPSHVMCCPLTVHALLHIAPTIRAMGPVWAYWAFPMEHHCGEILHNIRSQWFSYASINKYVTSQAQLTHITLLYNLHEKLQLKPPTSHDDNVCLPSCEPFICWWICMLIVIYQIHHLSSPHQSNPQSSSPYPCGKHLLWH